MDGRAQTSGRVVVQVSLDVDQRHPEPYEIWVSIRCAADPDDGRIGVAIPVSLPMMWPSYYPQSRELDAEFDYDFVCSDGLDTILERECYTRGDMRQESSSGAAQAELSLSLRRIAVFCPLVCRTVTPHVGELMSSAKLYVGNLSYSTTEASCKSLFEPHGEVTSVNLIMDRDSGRPKGFGFVQMATPEQAEAAREALNGTQLDGRTFKIDTAKEMTTPRSSQWWLRRRRRIRWWRRLCGGGYGRRKSLVTPSGHGMTEDAGNCRRLFLYTPSPSEKGPGGPGRLKCRSTSTASTTASKTPR